jgi:hypothetical protein
MSILVVSSVGEYGEIAVDAFTLDSEQPSVFGTVFFGARRDLHVLTEL